MYLYGRPLMRPLGTKDFRIRIISTHYKETLESKLQSDRNRMIDHRNNADLEMPKSILVDANIRSLLADATTHSILTS